MKVKTGEWGTDDYSFPSLPYKGTFLIKVEANNKTEDNAPIDCYYDIKVATHSGHAYKTTTTKATEKKDGKTVTACKICGAIEKTVMIPKASKITLSNTVYNYTGKAVSPVVSIKDRTGKALKNGKDYTVKYDSGRKTPGKYSVKVTFKGNYIGSKTLYFNILPTQTGKITATRTATSLKVNWKAVTGVDGYTVTLYSIHGYIIDKINTSKNTYTFKKLSSATTYKIKRKL